MNLSTAGAMERRRYARLHDTASFVAMILQSKQISPAVIHELIIMLVIFHMDLTPTRRRLYYVNGQTLHLWSVCHTSQEHNFRANHWLLFAYVPIASVVHIILK